VRLTLLLTSPRVAPGLLSWSAWSAISSASRRLCSSAADPLARAVAAAGHPVEVLPVAALPTLLTGERAGDGDGDGEGDGEGDIVWLASDEEAEVLPTTLATALVDGGGSADQGGEPQVEVLHASYDVPGARLLDLVGVMDRLRAECPWDREQTHGSLARYLLEETYETLEALETGDLDDLCEELGDLLLQVVFHARVAAEAGEDGFTIDDVAGGIVAKLVHRHPHVFAGLDVAGTDEVERNWDALKSQEKGRTSVLDGIPLAMPALALAEKVAGRAAKVGVVPRPASSLGERLLGLVLEARAEGADPEQALREAVRDLADAVRAAESQASRPVPRSGRG
jgi:XTP/dITP diphosphohydrolase